MKIGTRLGLTALILIGIATPARADLVMRQKFDIEFYGINDALGGATVTVQGQERQFPDRMAQPLTFQHARIEFPEVKVIAGKDLYVKITYRGKPVGFIIPANVLQEQFVENASHLENGQNVRISIFVLVSSMFDGDAYLPAIYLNGRTTASEVEIFPQASKLPPLRSYGAKNNRVEWVAATNTLGYKLDENARHCLVDR